MTQQGELINKSAFGLVLRQIRLNAGLTQERLALDCGLDPTYISLLERGKRSPTLDTVWILAEHLGLSPSDFVALVEQEIERQRNTEAIQ